MMERRFGLAIGLAMLVCASITLLANARFRKSLRVDQELCRFYVCANDFVLSEARERLWQLDKESVRSAVSLFRESLRRNPHSPFRWLDLSEAYLRSGEAEKAQSCLSTAVRVGPNDARVLLRAGNIGLQLGKQPQALNHLSRALELVRDYDNVIFRSYLLTGMNVELILEKGLPHTPEAGRAFMRHLLRSSADSESLEAIWNWLAKRSFEEEALAAEYMSILLQRSLYDEALGIYCHQRPEHCNHDRSTNPLLDPGFEDAPAGFALGWRCRPGSDFSLSHQPTCGTEGSGCLTFRFHGTENIEFRHLRQVVVAEPGIYRFRARVRAENLSTDQGLTFQISDVQEPSRFSVRTKAVTGSAEWFILETQVPVPRRTDLLDIRLVRDRSMKLDNKFGGVFEIDWVALEPISATLRPSARGDKVHSSNRSETKENQRSSAVGLSKAGQDKRLRERIGS